AGTSTPAAILQRLTQTLGGGPRDLPARQQSLDAAIDWSYALLTLAEQAVFRRLAVFEGGFPLVAAEAVCGGVVPRDQVRPALDRLVESSMLVREETAAAGAPSNGAPDQCGAGDAGEAWQRYRLLETIRQYAADRLAASGETVAARND